MWQRTRSKEGTGLSGGGGYLGLGGKAQDRPGKGERVPPSPEVATYF